MTEEEELLAANSLRRAQLNELVHEANVAARSLAAHGLDKLDAEDRTEALALIKRIEDSVMGGNPNLGKRRQKGMN